MTKKHLLLIPALLLTAACGSTDQASAPSPLPSVVTDGDPVMALASTLYNRVEGSSGDKRATLEQLFNDPAVKDQAEQAGVSAEFTPGDTAVLTLSTDDEECKVEAIADASALGCGMPGGVD